ncbi:unnamed protein product [Caenorhabditis brenneri]
MAGEKNNAGIALYEKICAASRLQSSRFTRAGRGRIRYFQGSYLFIWFTIPLLSGVAWFIVTAQVYPNGPMETEYIRNSAMETFGVEIEDCVYAAGVFYPIDQNGNRIVSWRTFLGLSCYLFLMVVPFTIIIIFGFKSWQIVNGLLKQGESEYAKNVQMQLYKALVAQTIIPMFFLFIPFGFLFTLPIFEINCQWLASLITLIFAAYPAVDPLPILYFIEYYRNPVIEFFKRAKCKSNRVSVEETEGSITLG